MIISFDQVAPVGGVIAFPEWAFPATPKDSSQILETTPLEGSPSDPYGLTGTVDGA